MTHIEETARIMADVLALARINVQRNSGTFTDEEALAAPLGFEMWGPNRPYSMGQRIRHGANEDGTPGLFQVMQDVAASAAGQEPGGAGMLAVYRPIMPNHTGAKDDPIPYTYGMDCRAGLYYNYGGQLYLCKGDMIPCVWYPGQAGVHQWEEAAE